MWDRSLSRGRHETKRIPVTNHKGQADELRRLADDARRVARSLNDGDSAQISPPFVFTYERQ
jgi:hypothetical protein